MFTRESSRKANRKRRRILTPKTAVESSRAATKRRKQLKEEDDELSKLMSLLRNMWLKDLHAQGSNNSLGVAGIKMIAKKMHVLHRFTAESVFLDIGSGAGLPCIYVSLRYKVRCIGVERDPKLVEIAQKYAKYVGLDEEQCRFIHYEASDLSTSWFKKKRVTHVFVFDACFQQSVLEQLYRKISLTGNTDLVGCSTVKKQRIWNRFVQKIGPSTQNAKMTGSGASSFSFGLWKLLVN